MNHFLPDNKRKGSFGIQGLTNKLVEGRQTKEDRSIKVGWIYDFITCLELVVKESNTKTVMKQY